MDDLETDQSIQEPLMKKSFLGDPEAINQVFSAASSIYETTSKNFQGYKDALFLVLFIINLLFLSAIALSYGAVAMINPGASYFIIDINGIESEDKNREHIPHKIIVGIGILLISAAGISSLWIGFLSKISSYIIHIIVISIVCISVICGLAFMFIGQPSLGFGMVLIALVTLIITLFYQGRIEFASINLQIASVAIISTPSTIFYSIFMLSIQALFVLVWCVAAFGFATNAAHVSKGVLYSLDECTSYKYASSLIVDEMSLTCPTGSTCYACFCEDVLVSNSPCFTPKFYWSSLSLLLLSLFWSSNVFSNIVHCTTAGAVTKWWHNGRCSNNEVVLIFQNMTTVCLGSICFGSLVSAIVRTLRSLFLLLKKAFCNSKKQDANETPFQTILRNVSEISLSVVDHILIQLERIVVYFNRYSLCYVAMYGQDYISSSKSALQLFQERGFTTLLNDDIIDFILFASKIIISFLCLSIAYIYGQAMNLPLTYALLLNLFGIFSGFVMSTIVLSTISSAVNAVYINFAQDPLVIKSSHPHLYPALINSWNKMFPRQFDDPEVGLQDYDPSEVEIAQPVSDESGSGTYFPTTIKGTFSQTKEQSNIVHGTYNNPQPTQDDNSIKTNKHIRFSRESHTQQSNQNNAKNTSNISLSPTVNFWSNSLFQMTQPNSQQPLQKQISNPIPISTTLNPCYQQTSPPNRYKPLVHSGIIQDDDVSVEMSANHSQALPSEFDEDDLPFAR